MPAHIAGRARRELTRRGVVAAKVSTGPRDFLDHELRPQGTLLNLLRRYQRTRHADEAGLAVMRPPTVKTASC
eukprot:COSAG01_NODE_10989_length_2031_cov_171.756808_2_plen_73_part_00